MKLYAPITLLGRWEVGLLACIINIHEELPSIQLVQSPMCESLQMGGRSTLPVVKHLTRYSDGNTVWNFDPPTYLPVNQNFIETLEILITNMDGTTPSFKNGASICVVHLTQRN